MELLTKKLFEQWMGTILERLERQDEMLLALKAPEKREHTPDRIRLFDNQDLCLLLQISKRSLHATAAWEPCPTRYWARRPITAKMTC